jgi:hypothetical protein
MLEEMNDNLQNADGQASNDLKEATAELNQENQKVVEVTETVEETTEPIVEVTETVEETTEPVAEVTETVEETTEPVAEVTETVEETTEPVAEVTETVEETTEPVAEVTEAVEETTEPVAEVSEPSLENKQDAAIVAIETINAEESEDNHSSHEIPLLDYESMSMEQLIGELTALVAIEKVMSVRNHVEEVKKSFLSKYYHFIDEKKKEFYTENPDTTEDFQYDFPLKSKFDQLYTLYREKKTDYFNSIQNSLKSNLKNRLELVEELKNLLHSQENISTTLKKFNDIKERWKVAGPIPKDKYNHVWNNYHFHLENFYDILHLDREIRDLDFKHNLVQKLKIIERAEELLNDPNLNNAFRELQVLHRIWKEEIGPVSKEHREEIWQKFSDITRQMHDKREQESLKYREIENAHLEKKNTIIEQIKALAASNENSHGFWQKQVEKVEALRNEYFGIGKVPQELQEETWNAFKNAVRAFNLQKNNFYKEIKKEQNDNLNRKQALIDKVNELKLSDDFATTTPLLKQIQEDWKTIGHVPRKVSDKMWTEFRSACNEYFNRLKEQRAEVNPEEAEAFANKKAYLEVVKAFELVGEHKTDLEAIKAHIETWKSYGKVPFSKRHIEGKFNKILDVLFEKLSASKKDTEKARYANRLDTLANTDSRKLDSEKVFIMRKIDEVQNTIFQLENNIQFFANAKADNPMVKEVRKNIEKQKDELDLLKDKLKQLRSVKAE